MMKKGDLVKLVLRGDRAGWPAGVVVSWSPAPYRREEGTYTRFPEGTVAVFLGEGRWPQSSKTYFTTVFIKGRVGWTHLDCLEAL